jgi:lipopolysaccharide transport system permease protein
MHARRQQLARFLIVLRAMTRRDLAARYRGSLLGVAWALLTPFLMMALYTTVFSVFLKVRLSSDAGPTAFALYLLAGLLPWTAFADAAGRSVLIIVGQQNLVKKVVFPLETIPLSVVCTALVQHAIALGLFLLAVLFWQGWSATLLLLPLALAPLALLTTGASLLLASLGVFLRDLGQAIGLLLTVGLFLTPIFYGPAAVPAPFDALVAANPFTALVALYRQIILDGRVEATWGLAWLYLVAVAVCALGALWFARTKRAFADVL